MVATTAVMLSFPPVALAISIRRRQHASDATPERRMRAIS